MPDVPKIVYDRLTPASRDLSALRQPHPDADLLTAFAEQALPAAERDGMLAHLALCADCRDVVALALPEAAVAAAPISAEVEDVGASVSRVGVPAPHKLRFAWPGLRWAALAAGVAVVAAVFLIRPANQEPSTIAEMASAPQIAVSSDVPASSNVTSSVAPQAPTVTPSPVVESQVSAKADSLKFASNKKERAVAAKVATTLPKDQAYDIAGKAGQGKSEPSAAGTQMARNIPASNPADAGDAPSIERAKPATPEQETKAIEKQSGAALSEEMPLDGGSFTAPQNLGPSANRRASAVSAQITWEIAGGVLQRSVDNGHTWQSVGLRSDHPLLCFAVQGTQIWTGGAAGSLFHSADRGITWTQVHPLIDVRELDSDITHIDIRSANGSGVSSSQVVISTSKESTNNRETWSSADGGKTWAKK